MDIPEPLQHALGDSITSGTFIDTKLWAFSSRNRTTRRVGNPQPLFVNGRVLRSLPYFQHALSGDDDVKDIREGFPDLLEHHLDDYDYSSDSDFEVDDEEVEPSKVGEPQTVAEAMHLDEGVSTALDNEKLGDIIDIEEEDVQSETSGVMSASDMGSAFAELDDTDHGTANPKHLVKTIVVPDVAFITLQAALRYLYTNDVEFAPPGGSKSRGKSESGRESLQALQPSPKSVYRLATKYDIPGLRILALEEIKRTLDKCDIIEEVFSKYTSRFPEIREVQVEHLARNLLSSVEPWKTAALKRKIEFYVTGALPHGQDVLPALYHRLSNPLFTSTHPLQPLQIPPRDGFDWQILKAELTKSLSNGNFLDTELRIPASRSEANGRPKLRSLYFCSAVGGEYTTKILSCVKDASSGHSETLDNAYRYDSDVEDEASESVNGNKPVEARSPRESPAASFCILNTGTWKTWSAILYYLYTKKINFGRLSSQPSLTVEDGASEKAGSRPVQGFRMPPSSPKSVYTLACTIGLLSLRSLAFEDFKSKIDSTNITRELLSPFSARHVTIRTLLLRVFETDLKSSSNEKSFITSLRTSADGQTPHRSAAIGLVFERLIEEGRKTLFPPTKPKPSSALEIVSITATNTTTMGTISSSNTGSSNGSEMTRLSSVKESIKSKKSRVKKPKLSKRPHSPPCGCGICKRAKRASGES